MAEILIVTGGTGGHIFPALEVKKMLENLKIKTKIAISEKNFFNFNADFKFSSAPLKGEKSLKIFINLFKIVKGIFESFLFLLKEKPKIVMLFGSYASFPFFISSLFLNRKMFVFEQNSIPGLVTRIASKFSDKIFISFKETQKFLKKKCIFIGNPVRDFERLDKNEALSRLNLKANKKVILFMGGSQGAKRLTETAIEYSKYSDNLILVLSGKFYEEFKNANLNNNIRLFPFRKDIDTFYSAADVIISRAGAGTVFELLKNKKKAIFVPYPYAADNHQLLNARFAQKMGTFEIIEEKELNIEKLKKKIEEILAKKGEFSEVPDWRSILKREVENAICIKRN